MSEVDNLIRNIETFCNQRKISLSTFGLRVINTAINATVYVSQIEDHRVEEVIHDGAYLEKTTKVLNKHGKQYGPKPRKIF